MIPFATVRRTGLRGFVFLLVGCLLHVPFVGAQSTTEPVANEIPVVDGEALRAWATEYLTSLPSGPTEMEDTWSHDHEVLRALYFLSVESRNRLDEATDSLATWTARYTGDAGAARTLEAYRGAIEVVKAKHARWPPNKLKHLNAGGEVLDSLVGAYPDDLEQRYLRFASYVHLPFFLRRDSELREDTARLAESLGTATGAFPPEVLAVVIQSVLNTGPLTEEQRFNLTEALAQSKTEH